MLQRTGQRRFNFQDRAGNVPPLNNGVSACKLDLLALDNVIVVLKIHSEEMNMIKKNYHHLLRSNILLSFIYTIVLPCLSLADPTITVRIGPNTISDGTVITVGRPFIPGFGIQVDVPRDEELLFVSLNYDDTCIPGGDTSFELYNRFNTSCPLKLKQRPIGSSVRFTFEQFTLPLWQIGSNLLNIVATTTIPGEGGRFGPPLPTAGAIFSITFQFDLPSPNFGIGRAGRAALGTLFNSIEFNVPIWADRVPLGKDGDLDGLLDLWENIALKVLRPTLALDEDDEFWDNQPDHHLRIFTRVFPVRHRASEFIIFSHVMAWTKDYGTDIGPFTIASHNGDRSFIRTVWEVINGHEIQLRKIFTNGHHCDFCAPKQRIWEPEDVDFTAEGFMKIFIEEDKHGTWPSFRSCDEEAAFDCKATEATTTRPPTFNVGEPPPLSEATMMARCVDRISGDVGRPFIDQLDDVERECQQPELTGIFPGEAIWNDTNCFFCGGLGTCDIFEALGSGIGPGGFGISPRFIGGALIDFLGDFTPFGNIFDRAIRNIPQFPLFSKHIDLANGLILDDDFPSSDDDLASTYIFDNINLFTDYLDFAVTTPSPALRFVLENGLFRTVESQPLRTTIAPIEPEQPDNFIHRSIFSPYDAQISRKNEYRLQVVGDRRCFPTLEFAVSPANIPPDIFDAPDRNDSFANTHDLGILPSSDPTASNFENLSFHVAGDIDYYKIRLPHTPIPDEERRSDLEPPDATFCASRLSACSFVPARLCVVIYEKRYDPSFQVALLNKDGEVIEGDVVIGGRCVNTSDEIISSFPGDEIYIKVESIQNKRNFYTLAISYADGRWEIEPRFIPEERVEEPPSFTRFPCDFVGPFISGMNFFQGERFNFAFPSNFESIGFPCPDIFYFRWPFGGSFQIDFAMQNDLDIRLLNAQFQLITKAKVFTDSVQLKSIIQQHDTLSLQAIQKRLFVPKLEAGHYVVSVVGENTSLFSFQFIGKIPDTTKFNFIDFETIPGDTLKEDRQIIRGDTYIQLGVKFSAEISLQDAVVGIAKNGATSACVDSKDLSDHVLGTGRSSSRAVGLGTFAIRAHFDPPVTEISAEMQTLLDPKHPMRLRAFAGNKQIGQITSSGKESGNCNLPGRPRTLGKLKAIAPTGELITDAIFDVMGKSKIVFVIDNLRFVQSK